MAHQEVETHRGVKFQDAVGSLTMTVDELIFMQDPTKAKPNDDGLPPKYISHSWEWEDIETVCAVYKPEDGKKKRKAKRMLQIKSTGSKKLGPQTLSLHITEKALQKIMPGLESRLNSSRERKKEAAMRKRAAKKRDSRMTTNKRPPRRSNAASQVSKKNEALERKDSESDSSSEEFVRQTRRPTPATATPGLRLSASDNALNRGHRPTKTTAKSGMLLSSSDHYSMLRNSRQTKTSLAKDEGQGSRFNRRYTADMTSTSQVDTNQAGSSSKENTRMRFNRRHTADMTSASPPSSPSSSGSKDNANITQREISLGPLGYEYDAKEFSLCIPSFETTAPAQPSTKGIPKSGSLNNIKSQRQFPFFRHFGASRNSVLRTPKPAGQLSQENQHSSSRHPIRKHLLYFLRTPPPRSQSFSDEASLGPSRKTFAQIPHKNEENEAQKATQKDKQRHRRLLRRTSSDSKLRAARRQQASLQGTPQKERLNEVIAGRRHRKLLRRTSSDSKLRNGCHESIPTAEQQQQMEAPTHKFNFSSMVGTIKKPNLWQMNKMMPGRRALLRRASSDSNIRTQQRQTLSKSLMDHQEWKQHVKFASSDVAVVPNNAPGLETFKLQERGEDQQKGLKKQEGKGGGWKKPLPLELSLKEVPEDTTAEVTGHSKEANSTEKQQTISRSAQKDSAIRLKSRDFEIAQRYFDSQPIGPAEAIVEDEAPPEMIEIRPRVMTDQTSAVAVAWFTKEVRETSNRLPGTRPTQPMGLRDGGQSFTSFASSEFTVSDAGSFLS